MFRTGYFGRFVAAFYRNKCVQEKIVKGAQRLYARHQKSLLYSTGGGTTLALSLFGSGKKDASQTEHKDKDYGVLQAIRESDSFYTMYMIDNAYAVLRKYRNSEDPEVLWRLARIICEQGKMCKNAEEKKRLFNEALEMAEKAIKNGGASGLFAAHKWYAIILDYVGEQEGTKSRIKRSYDVKVHLERALELNPLDATTWHILGVWHFTFADMPSYQRLAAKAIFGTPPSSTYEEALRHFERAESIQPGFYTANQYYLGQVYERLGQKDKAIEQYQQAFRAPVVTVDDADIHTRVYERLKKLGVQVESTVPKPIS